MLAGATVAMVALPLCIAIAIASGAEPEKGIFTAIVAGFLISLFGGSRVQIGGPTGAFIVVVYGVIAQYGYDGLVVATRSEEHTSELQSLMRISYAVFCLKKKKTKQYTSNNTNKPIT